MLILTRKIDQGIVISGNIIVRVLGVERDRVKIGIAAPAEITVLREELLESGRARPANHRSNQSDSGGKPAAPSLSGKQDQEGNES